MSFSKPLFYSSQRPEIKEAKKETAPISRTEDYVEVVILKIPAGTPSSEVEAMFRLCEPTKVVVQNTDNYYTSADVTMSKSGFETVIMDQIHMKHYFQAKKFDGLEVEWKTKLDWPVPIRVILKEQHVSVSYTAQNIRRRKNYTVLARDCRPV